MKRLLLIGFLMLFMTALIPVSVNANVFVDNDVGIEFVQLNDNLIAPFDLSVNLIASCPDATPLKYPMVEQSSDFNFDFMLGQSTMTYPDRHSGMIVINKVKGQKANDIHSWYTYVANVEVLAVGLTNDNMIINDLNTEALLQTINVSNELNGKTTELRGDELTRLDIGELNNHKNLAPNSKTG